jgi:hypothetical protein
MTLAADTIQPSLRTACVLAAVSTLVMLGIVHAPASVSPYLKTEFGVVENVSALAYPVGAWFALRLASRSEGWERANWVLWVVLCVLFFGEETSWMQHWLGYATPESIKAVNDQSEFNLHNLHALTSSEALVGPGGAHLSRKLLSAQNLFYAGFATYFVLLPLAMLATPVRLLARRLGVPQIGPAFVLMVVWTMAVSVVLSIVYRDDIAMKVQIAETREMFCALFIAGFIAMAYAATRQRRARTVSATLVHTAAAGRD